MMFSVHCPTHDSTILLTRRNALSFWNGPDGPVIRWRCNCGQEGLLDRHGSRPLPTETTDDLCEAVVVETGVAAVSDTDRDGCEATPIRRDEGLPMTMSA